MKFNIYKLSVTTDVAINSLDEFNKMDFERVGAKETLVYTTKKQKQMILFSNKNGIEYNKLYMNHNDQGYTYFKYIKWLEVEQ